jgi:hypothetical protein
MMAGAVRARAFNAFNGRVLRRRSLYNLHILSGLCALRSPCELMLLLRHWLSNYV